jgi:hypothetical protein
MLKFPNSSIAAGAIYLSLKMTKNPQPWSEALIKHAQYKE